MAEMKPVRAWGVFDHRERLCCTVITAGNRSYRQPSIYVTRQEARHAARFIPFATVKAVGIIEPKRRAKTARKGRK